MTVSVSAVFMMPSSNPPITIISTIIAVIEVCTRASTTISTVSRPSVVSSVGISSIRRVSIGRGEHRGDREREAQPKNTPPMPIAPNSMPCAAAAISRAGRGSRPAGKKPKL